MVKADVALVLAVLAFVTAAAMLVDYFLVARGRRRNQGTTIEWLAREQRYRDQDSIGEWSTSQGLRLENAEVREENERLRAELARERTPSANPPELGR